MAQAQPETRVLATAAIAPHPANPRKRFDEQALAELGASIQRVGLLEPLVVRISRRVGHNDTYDDAYELIAGERRWRAAQAIGLEAVPCRVLELDDAAAAEAMLAENLQRQDLTPMEEARAFQAWIAAQPKAAKGERPNWPKALAERLGKSEDYVRERLRLLELDAKLQERVESGEMPLKQARVVARAEPKERARVAEALERGNAEELTWSVRSILTLEQAPFGLDGAAAAALGDGVRACHGCPDREQLLGEDLCANARCYGQKLEAFARVNLKATVLPKMPPGAERFSQWRKGCPGCEGREVVLGPHGSLHYVCRKPRGHYGYGSTSDGGGARYQPTAADKAARKKVLERQRKEAEFARNAEAAALAWLVKRPPAELVGHAFGAVVRHARYGESEGLGRALGLAEKNRSKRDGLLLALAKDVKPKDAPRLLAALTVAWEASGWGGGGAVGLCRRLGIKAAAKGAKA